MFTKLINAVAFLVVWASWRIYRLSDIIKFHLGNLRDGDDAVVQVIEGFQEKRFENAAVVVGAYNNVFENSTRRLLSGLKSNGFDVYLVWNGAISQRTIDLALPECVQVIRRKGRGFDWAGYKHVFNRLGQDSAYDEAGLYLSNDSFFYFEEVENSISQLLDLPGDVKGMVFNKEIYPHLVGANVYLSANARKSPHVVSFWNNFKPSWDKRTTIFKGEIEHFRKIAKSGLQISVLTSSFAHEKDKIADVAMRYSERFDLFSGFEGGGEIRSRAAIRNLGELFETRSVLHVVGPYLTKHWGLPLKLDLIKWPASKWSTMEISEILSSSPFVSEQDLRFIEAHFGTKNSWASIDSQLTKLFFQFGFFK